MRRAEAELERTEQAAARLRARAARRITAADRAAAAACIEETVDAEEHAWMADRRDFVAVDRDQLADERDTIADRREEAAGLREHAADDRERDLLDRERRFDQARPTGRRAGAARRAAGRRAAAQDRARAAAKWGPQQYGPMLLASFAPLAQQLFTNDDLREVLAQVLKFTVGAVAGCDYASVTLCRHGGNADTITTDPVAAELDDIQFATGIGPGPEAMHSGNPVYAAELAGFTALADPGRHRRPTRRGQCRVPWHVHAPAGSMVGARRVHPLQRDTRRIQR